MATRRKPSARKRARGRKSNGRTWSARVTRESDALDLERKVFSQKSPARIAASLKRSAERSRRRKSSPYQSAMSMLTFYINRAGKNLPAGRKRTLVRAKAALREAFGRA
jgi:hypothetical protein